MKFDPKEFMNPFHKVTWGKEFSFSHSRTLHTDFLEKVEDALGVLLRLFDYLTFGILFLVTWLKDLCKEEIDKSLHDRTARYDLILLSANNKQSVDIEALQRISDEHNGKPVLARKNNKLVLYGLSEEGWKITHDLSPDAFRDIIFSDNNNNEAILLDKEAIPYDAFQEMTSKKGHLDRGMKWFLFGCLKCLLWPCYLLLLGTECLGDYVLRIVFAVILTILSLVVIAPVHVCSRIALWAMEKEAEDLAVSTTMKNHTTTTKTLKQFLIDNERKNLTSLELWKIEKQPVNTEEGEKMQTKLHFRFKCGVSNVSAYAVFFSSDDSRIRALAHVNTDIDEELTKKNFFSNENTSFSHSI